MMNKQANVLLTCRIGEKILIDDGYGKDHSMITLHDVIVQEKGKPARIISKAMAKPNIFKHFESFITEGDIVELECKEIGRFNDYFEKPVWPLAGRKIDLTKEDLAAIKLQSKTG